MIYHGEGLNHRKAKRRLCNLIEAIGCKFVDTEYEYPNPFYPDYPWRFDIFCIYHGRHIAIEIDGKVGHSSKKAKDKRAAKIRYLKQQDIELFAFPTAWVYSRKQLPDSLFIEELHLK